MPLPPCFAMRRLAASSLRPSPDKTWQGVYDICGGWRLCCSSSSLLGDYIRDAVTSRPERISITEWGITLERICHYLPRLRPAKPRVRPERRTPPPLRLLSHAAGESVWGGQPCRVVV